MFSVTHFDCEYPIPDAVLGSFESASRMILSDGGLARTEARDEQKRKRA